MVHQSRAEQRREATELKRCKQTNQPEQQPRGRQNHPQGSRPWSGSWAASSEAREPSGSVNPIQTCMSERQEWASAAQVRLRTLDLRHCPFGGLTSGAGATPSTHGVSDTSMFCACPAHARDTEGQSWFREKFSRDLAFLVLNINSEPGSRIIPCASLAHRGRQGKWQEPHWGPGLARAGPHGHLG